MYELITQIKIKELLLFKTPSSRMAEEHLRLAYNCGVDVGELSANTYVYEYSDDLIFSVEYVKMICNLVIIFRDLFDKYLYTLRMLGYTDNRIYSSINFHNVFNKVNHEFNINFIDQFLFEEIGIYHSEVSLETAIYLYEVFNTQIISELKDFIEADKLKFIITKHNMKYLPKIHGDIMNQLENVFYIV